MYDYFRELSTLKRTRDVALKVDGSKFVLSFGFGLTKAQIDYLSYKVNVFIEIYRIDKSTGIK